MSGRTTVEQSTDPRHRFDLLFQAHYEAIYRYCARRLGRTEAEDAAADVFAVAWRRLDEMPAGDASRAWLYGVAYRVIGNRFRGRRRQAGLASKLETSVRDTGPQPVSDPAVELIYRALGGMSASDQELLRLSSWDGLSRREIAHVLSIKENAVDQRLYRARARLWARVDDLHQETSTSKAKEAST